jgi:hypothetical protein
VGFSKIHVFPFSARRGTPAAQMPDQVPKAIRAERGRRMAEIEQSLRERYFRSLLGRTLRVLVESPRPAKPTGRGHLVPLRAGRIVRRAAGRPIGRCASGASDRRAMDSRIADLMREKGDEACYMQ